MLKFIFWLLVLGNAGLLAYQQGLFDAFVASGREPARLKQQLNADKVRIIPAPEPKQAPEPPAPSEPQPGTSPPVEAPVSLGSEPAKAPEPARTTLVCLEVGNFGPEDARRFSAQLAALGLGDRVAQRPVQEVASHMVYIPPQPDRESAERKAAELRQLGVDDFFVIQDNSSMRWGISLGVFKQEEAARAHLSALSQKGVRSARIGQRTVTSSQVAFRLRDLDDKSAQDVERIKAGYPKQEMRRCPG